MYCKTPPTSTVKRWKNVHLRVNIDWIIKIRFNRKIEGFTNVKNVVKVSCIVKDHRGTN